MRTKKPIVCIYCQKGFNHRHRLFRHMTDKHLVHCPENSVIVTLDFLRQFTEDSECRLTEEGTECMAHRFVLFNDEPCPQQELKDILGE